MELNITKIYERMFLIRKVEELLLDLFSKGKLNGTTHTSIGQEACSVGVTGQLSPERDVVFSNHRCHGHYLAFTGNLRGLLAEIIGKSSGLCRGIGGSQHIHDQNFFSNGIQGGIVPPAVGIAFAEKLNKNGGIVEVTLGDGTLGEGVVYESFNIASLWELPVLFLLENNKYAQSTPIQSAHAGNLAERAKSFAISWEYITVREVEDVLCIAEQVIKYIRETNKPFFLGLETYRLAPHSKGDDYRDTSEINYYQSIDPLLKLAGKINEMELMNIQNKVIKMVMETLQDLENDPVLNAEAFLKGVKDEQTNF